MTGAGHRWLPVLGLLGVTGGCGQEADSRGTAGGPAPQVVTTPTPTEHVAGERLFDTYCAGCHGPRAAGSPTGPPLIHVIYEPNHHADVAFYRAAQFGVRAHHWRLGDMPPVQGIGEAEVRPIVSYLRWLQRQAGIH